MMLLQVSFPGFLGNAITSLSKCTSPVSMLVIGSILAGVDAKKMFDRYTAEYIALRLVIFPLIVFAILKLIGIEGELLGVSVLMTAMPAGSTCAILAQKYGADAEYGASLIFTSTLCSIVTLPLMALFL